MKENKRRNRSKEQGRQGDGELGSVSAESAVVGSKRKKRGMSMGAWENGGWGEKDLTQKTQELQDTQVSSRSLSEYRVKKIQN